MTFIRYEQMRLNIDDLLQGDVRLASPPEIYARLHRLLESPGSSTALLAEVIEHDPALSTRILKLVNSNLYTLPHPVDNIGDAVKHAGVRGLHDLVLATEVIQRFDRIPPELEDIYSFWRQSMRCAMLSSKLAEQRKESSPGSNDSMFLAGLLHRIGLLVMYARIPELSRKALLEHRHRGLPLHAVQQELLGFDYAMVGAALARRWKLPDMLCTILADHLHPEQTETYKSETALTHLSALASQADTFDRQVIEPLLPQDDVLWKTAGVTPQTLLAILPEAQSAYGAALALLH
jgi:HD-like signal output (HDOD) protein